MTTFTFLRKFIVRFSLGMAVLAAPRAVLGSEGHDDNPGHGDDDGDVKVHVRDGDGSHVHIKLDDDALDRIESMLSQFDSFSCNATRGGALDALAGG